MKAKVILAFGTRPEAIKMAPLYAALRRAGDTFEATCCVTAQHRHLLDQVLDTFGIVPDVDLDLMREGQDLAGLHAAVITGMRDVFVRTRPDLVMVHGDTTTSMASAMAAFYAGIPVGHIEAGLRSGDLGAPFPEELNRRVIATLAKYHFAPTATDKSNLLVEGHDPDNVFVTGNTVLDSLAYIRARIGSDGRLRDAIEAQIDRALDFKWRDTRYVIVTCHRRENCVGALPAICMALDRLASRFPDVHFVLPIHPNPSVREPMRLLLAGRARVHLLEPQPYEHFAQLLRHCHSILTDSGGLQEEGPMLGKPVLVLRHVTERTEAVAGGGVKLVGTDTDAIVAGLSELLADSNAYAAMAQAPNPFGDGKSAERIVKLLRGLLGVGRQLVPA